jgi:hypothetical protein
MDGTAREGRKYKAMEKMGACAKSFKKALGVAGRIDIV